MDDAHSGSDPDTPTPADARPATERTPAQDGTGDGAGGGNGNGSGGSDGTGDGDDTGDGTGPSSGSDPDPAADGRAAAVSPSRVDDLAREYEAAGEPFARVTVVRREPPVSANVGDRAIVTSDGELIGWVGGAACAQSVTVKEATAALADGEPRLVGLAPDPAEVDRPGVAAYPMTCHSGGTLELFVEPVTPTPRLAVVGTTPVATALRRLGGDATYDVTAVVDAETAGATADPAGLPAGADETVAATDAATVAAALEGVDAVVVTSMGEYDALGVEAALRAEVPYVGLVASDRRRDELADRVADALGAGVTAEDVVAAVTTPAGLDLGAKAAEEIAIAVLAELVAVRRGVEGPVDVTVGDTARVRPDGAATASTRVAPDDGDADTDGDGGSTEDGPSPSPSPAETGSESGTATVTDPVCGMDVVVGEAAATATHEGTTYHFCGQGCADAFEADPGSYLEVVPGE
jgi:xanthine dehydrogenase accessory factor